MPERPVIISVAGSGSGAGKTTVCENIIRGLGLRFGAIKYTRSDLYSSLTDDDETIETDGKDTQRLKSAGASGVQWISSTEEDMEELLGVALSRLDDLDAVIIEGNGPVSYVEPDVLIFVEEGGGDPKRGARALLERADFVLYSEKPSIKKESKMYNKHSDNEMITFVRDLGIMVKAVRENG